MRAGNRQSNSLIDHRDHRHLTIQVYACSRLLFLLPPPFLAIFQSTRMKKNLLKLIPAVCFSLVYAMAFAAPAFAQSNGLNNESNTFLGIDLNKPFPGEMLACPQVSWTHMVDPHALENITATCYMQLEKNYFKLYKTPDLGLGNTVEIRTYDGYPAVFLLIAHVSRFTKMENLFVTRYGKPASAVQSTVKNRRGESFDNRTLTWKGKIIGIRIDSRGEHVDQSQAVITSLQAAKQRDADYKDAALRGSGKL